MSSPERSVDDSELPTLSKSDGNSSLFLVDDSSCESSFQGIPSVSEGAIVVESSEESYDDSNFIGESDTETPKTPVVQVKQTPLSILKPKLTCSTPTFDPQSPAGRWRSNAHTDQSPIVATSNDSEDDSSEFYLEESITAGPSRKPPRRILDSLDEISEIEGSPISTKSPSRKAYIQSSDEEKSILNSSGESVSTNRYADYRQKFKVKPKSGNLSANISAASDTSVKSTASHSSKVSENLSKYSMQEIERQITAKKKIMQSVKLSNLPDRGDRLKNQLSDLEEALSIMSLESSKNDSNVSKASEVVSDFSYDSVRSNETSSPSSTYGHQKNTIEEEPEIEILETSSELSNLQKRLSEKMAIQQETNPQKFPDRGQSLAQEIRQLEKQILFMQMKEQAGGTSNRPNSFKPNLIKGSEPKPYRQTTLQEFNLQSGAMLAAMQSTTLSKNNINALYGADKDYGARNYGGKLSSKNHQSMVRVTTDAIEVIHKALKTMPDVDTAMEKDPKSLSATLLPHQKRALCWLLWRECQNPPGGILADDMGLGKTLTMISLMLRYEELVESGTIKDFTPDFAEESSSKPEGESWIKKSSDGQCKRSLITSKGSLVVCPASLLGQWQGEADKHVQSDAMTVHVYHGNNRDVSRKRLAQFDMVITTYQLVRQEAFQSSKAKASKKQMNDVPTIGSEHQGLLFQVGWRRIILDEAHQVRNHKSLTAQAVCLLKGGRRWAVTGTPVQNKDMDLYSIIRFLRVEPFDNYTTWKHQVASNTAQGKTRLNILVKALLLRRTKDQTDVTTGEALVKLPPKKTVQHSIALSQEERQIYDRVFVFSRSALAQYMKNQEQKEFELINKHKFVPESQPKDELTPTLPSGLKPPTEVSGTSLLVLLLRLRQICCHPSLITAMIEENPKEVDGFSGEASEASQEDDLISQLTNMSMNPAADEKVDNQIKDNVLTLENPAFKRKTISSKIERVISELKETRSKGRDKSVIVSQWTTMLEVMYKHLKKAGFACSAITGQVPVKERAAIVTDFNSDAKEPQILLLSLGAGGVGLNLVGANHLFLLDMHWNPQLEAQASDRIYRVGQKKPVTIHRFVMENTIEERILDLQKKKMELAESVLTGAKHTVTNKLSLNDIKLLFNVTD